MGTFLVSTAASSFAVLLLLLAHITPHFCISADSTIPSSSPPPCIERERRALLEFKASLNDSTNWLSSWKGLHCCQWEGVVCHNTTAHVLKLLLKTPLQTCFSSLKFRHHYSNLEYEECEELYGSRYYVEAAEVNPSLLQLEYLTHLDLTGNDFNQNQIPTFIGSMQRLRYLSLSQANFGGTIPSTLGKLKNLQFLDLSWNYQLEASENINWMSRLESLEHLDMSGVFYSDNSHKLFQQVNLTNAPQLQVLILAHNDGLTLSDLDGLQNMTSSSLVHLDLSSNYFITSVPSWFGNFEKLEFLDLSGCGLHGPIPDAFKNITSIEALYLFGNELDFVPSWYRKFEKIKHLDLSSNVFRGPIPDAFKNMTSIETLYLSTNEFDFVPSWFRKFEKIKHLDLSFNRFQGPIPDDIRHMSSIEFLDLSQNNFTSVPSWFAELKTFLHLDLSSNQLTSMECSISSILRTNCHLKNLDLSQNKLQEKSIGPNDLVACNRYDLERLDLSYNKFSTHLPSWLEQQENLQFLSVQENIFYGLIPFSFKKLRNLQGLYLSNNKLEGPLPNDIGHLVSLKNLDLSNNFFNGSIPKTFGQLINLNDLDLSNNHLTGTIPQNVVQLVNLYHLNLSRNELHGSIPIEFGQLVNLGDLDLSSNNLDGVITFGKNWSSVMSLWYLDLSNNQISGSLPVHIGHTIPNMEFLLLGNNRINGSIPNSLCKMELTSLDISNNTLSGAIPNCWKDNKRWGEINLSSNKLSGEFPSSIMNLSTLVWLHLNNNNLLGELPVYLKNLTQLLILDVGENKFSGYIPYTFPSLQVLRLRQNKLSGGIPSQLCQLSSLKILDLSRNNLQGSIPYCIGNLRGMTLNKSTTDLAPTTVELDVETETHPPGTNGWSDEDVKQVMKGRELDYTKNLVLVVNMDLSENNLIGVIPTGITLLNGLLGLNLSNNHLKGEIPEMIGDMKSLESFDVSNNQLSGTIPRSMSALTLLSRLNLSQNNFSGPIPTSNQFPTYDQSSYVGNPYLCGLPLPKKCPGDNSAQGPMNRGFEDEDGKTSKLEKWLFYLVVAAGFATGFWGVIGVLFFKKSWRHAYFRWVEDIADKIYVATALKVAKLRKRAASNPADD